MKNRTLYLLLINSAVYSCGIFARNLSFMTKNFKVELFFLKFIRMENAILI